MPIAVSWSGSALDPRIQEYRLDVPRVSESPSDHSGKGDCRLTIETSACCDIALVYPDEPGRAPSCASRFSGRPRHGSGASHRGQQAGPTAVAALVGLQEEYPPARQHPEQPRRIEIGRTRPQAPSATGRLTCPGRGLLDHRGECLLGHPACLDAENSSRSRAWACAVRRCLLMSPDRDRGSRCGGRSGRGYARRVRRRSGSDLRLHQAPRTESDLSLVSVLFPSGVRRLIISSVIVEFSRFGRGLATKPHRGSAIAAAPTDTVKLTGRNQSREVSDQCSVT
jgi:hypothetical protein